MAKKKKGPAFDKPFGRMKNKNQYKRYYDDASVLLLLAEANRDAGHIYITRLPRAAILLLVVALEALSNGILEDWKDIVGAEKSENKDGNDDLSVDLPKEKAPLVDKLKAIGRNHPRRGKKKLNTAGPIWRSVTELIKWRHEYVHPKLNLPELITVKKRAEGFWEWTTIKPSDVPMSLRDRLETNKYFNRYGHSGLPQNNSDVTLEDAKRVKAIVDKFVQRLDKILEGHLSNNDFLEDIDEGEMYFKIDEHRADRQVLNIKKGFDINTNLESYRIYGSDNEAEGYASSRIKKTS